jgi:hypothetical protein
MNILGFPIKLLEAGPINFETIARIGTISSPTHMQTSEKPFALSVEQNLVQIFPYSRIYTLPVVILAKRQSKKHPISIQLVADTAKSNNFPLISVLRLFFANLIYRISQRSAA